jgi:hypothetical protein
MASMRKRDSGPPSQANHSTGERASPWCYELDRPLLFYGPRPTQVRGPIRSGVHP